MTQTHPITPPPELVEEWWNVALPNRDICVKTQLCTQAARWGADQELEACCKWLPKLPPWSGNDLRKHRRPKPPSLKEQALEVLERMDQLPTTKDKSAIRRALEALDD